jgi:splicing factor U2AF subunit
MIETCLLVVSDSSGQPKPDQANVLAQAQHHIAIQKLALQASGANAVALGGLGMMSGIPPGLMASMLPGMGNGLSNTLETPTKVVALTQVVSADELKDDEEYDDILEDMREECGKFGMSFIPGRSHNIHICLQEPVSCFCARI